MTREEAIKKARDVKRLIDHPDTPPHERDSAKRVYKDVMVRYMLEEEDLDPREELEPDTPESVSYEEVWKSVAAHMGMDEQLLQEHIGSGLATILNGVPLFNKLPWDKADKRQLGKVAATAVVELLQKGLKK